MPCKNTVGKKRNTSHGDNFLSTKHDKLRAQRLAERGSRFRYLTTYDFIVDVQTVCSLV